MQRRAFIAGGLGACALASPQPAEAELSCEIVGPGVQRCTAGLPSNVAPQREQLSSQWCWAACIEMVFRYHGFQLNQERIVRDVWGDIVNLPGRPDQILMSLNRTWIDENGRRFSSQADAMSANPVTAAQDLAQGFPLIVGTMGHAMVLTALRYHVNAYGQGEVFEAIVRDPWPGRGRRTLSAQEWYGVQFAARVRVG